jgi:CheY-like chemotaxis protein
VLIVDDSADVRELYSAWLEYSRFQVLTASDGETAIHIAVENQPDVIVMDFSMPHLDGIGALRGLRGNRRTERIPVIMLTGYPFATINESAREAGADIVLTKPCLPEELERSIRQILTSNRNTKLA